MSPASKRNETAINSTRFGYKSGVKMVTILNIRFCEWNTQHLLVQLGLRILQSLSG